MRSKFSVTLLHPSPGKDGLYVLMFPGVLLPCMAVKSPEAWLSVIRINATLPNGWLCLSIVFSPHWVTWNELCSFCLGSLCQDGPSGCSDDLPRLWAEEASSLLCLLFHWLCVLLAQRGERGKLQGELIAGIRRFWLWPLTKESHRAPS